jgi:hypothetical protein
MEMQIEQQKVVDSMADQHMSNKLIQLIRKLRWLGMEEEAQTLEDKLTRRNVALAESVVAASHETD